MSSIPFHPLADLFPLIEGQEFEDLAESILEHGLREPITLYEEKILDGRNRYRACEAAGAEPRFETFTGNDPASFVCDKNIHRRHLSASQRALISAQMANLVKGQTARRPGHHPETSGSSITIGRAAELLNVSPEMVTFARTILKHGTEDEVEAIREGKASVSTLAKQIRDKVPSEKRAKRQPNGGRAAQQLAQQANAKIWSVLRDAITNLTSLPQPSEVVRIARFSDRGRLLDARLSDALQYLKEFAHEWSNSDLASERKKSSADSNANAGNGHQSSGA